LVETGVAGFAVKYVLLTMAQKTAKKRLETNYNNFCPRRDKNYNDYSAPSSGPPHLRLQYRRSTA